MIPIYDKYTLDILNKIGKPDKNCPDYLNADWLMYHDSVGGEVTEYYFFLRFIGRLENFLFFWIDEDGHLLYSVDAIPSIEINDCVLFHLDNDVLLTKEHFYNTKEVGVYELPHIQKYKKRIYKRKICVIYPF